MLRLFFCFTGNFAISCKAKNAPLRMRTLLQRKMSHKCDAKAAREFRKRNSLFCLFSQTLCQTANKIHGMGNGLGFKGRIVFRCGIVCLIGNGADN